MRTAAVGARYGVVVVVARASTLLSTDRGSGGDVGDVVFVVVHARVCSMRSSARSEACFQLVFVKI